MQAIGIDIGTTSICGIAYDIELRKIIKSITKNSDAFIKTSHSWERIQSVEKIINTAQEILDELISLETVSIGVTGQMHGMVYVDNKGSNLSNLYTWQDERGLLPYKDTTYAEFIGDPFGYASVTDFYNSVNGIKPLGTSAYCTIQDFFVMKLCGLDKPTIHLTDAASFGKGALCNANITDDFVSAGEYMNIPVSVAIGDNQASVFSALRNEEDVLVNIGTGSQVSIISKTEIERENIESRPYFNGKYLVVGSALCGGRAYSMLKNFYEQIAEMFGINAHDTYTKMNNLIIDKDFSSLKVDTRFAGTRCNPEIRGCITNISMENFNVKDLTYSVLYGMGNELFDMYREMGVKRYGVVGSGNAIRMNPTLKNIVSNQFESDIKIPAFREEAAFGAALFSLVSTGRFSSASEAQQLIEYICCDNEPSKRNCEV